MYMYTISVAILSQGCSLVKVVSAKMTALEDALALLGLQLPFTSSQLRKQYHRSAKIFHPDKEGGMSKRCRESWPPTNSSKGLRRTLP